LQRRFLALWEASSLTAIASGDGGVVRAEGRELGCDIYKITGTSLIEFDFFKKNMLELGVRGPRLPELFKDAVESEEDESSGGSSGVDRYDPLHVVKPAQGRERLPVANTSLRPRNNVSAGLSGDFDFVGLRDENVDGGIGTDERTVKDKATGGASLSISSG
jgi:hypothetical protein